MLTLNQTNYLNHLSKDKANQIVSINPYHKEALKTAEELILEIKKLLPHTKLFFLGSVALGIAGMNDIDLSVVSSESFDEDRRKITDIYGSPKDSHKRRYALWEFNKNKFPVELS